MQEKKFEHAFITKLLKEITSQKDVKKAHLEKVFNAIKKRYMQAVKLIREGRVKKYVFTPSKRVVWTVIGRTREYLIIPIANFCSCDDFYFHVINREVPLCYHLIAQKLAEAQKLYDVIETPDDNFEELMRKWKTIEIEKRKIPVTELKNIREGTKAILSEIENLSIGDLLVSLKTIGFDVLTTKHLANILTRDKEKRFLCVKGKWKLRS